MALEHEALTVRIIGAAIEVHRRLGPVFLESVSEKALVYYWTSPGQRSNRSESSFLSLFGPSCLPRAN
jgi:hypothetical protein